MRLVQTCSACPEQYDVLDDDGFQIGYLRLRWGEFTVEVPDAVRERSGALKAEIRAKREGA